jgi:hypothetical protein
MFWDHIRIRRLSPNDLGSAELAAGETLSDFGLAVRTSSGVGDMTAVHHPFGLVELGEASGELLVGVAGFLQQSPKSLDDQKGPAQAFIENLHRGCGPGTKGCGCGAHPGPNAFPHHVLGYYRKHGFSLRLPTASEQALWGTQV